MTGTFDVNIFPPPLAVGPDDGRFGPNYRKVDRSEFPESSAAEPESARSGSPRPDSDSDFESPAFTQEKSQRDQEIRAGKASKDKAEASSASKSGKGKGDKAKEADNLRKKALVDAIKEGIHSSPNPSEVIIVETFISA